MKNNSFIRFVWLFVYTGLCVGLFVSALTAIEGVVSQNMVALGVGFFGMAVTSYGIAVVSSRIIEQST